jgi:hypothetical protein
MDRVRSACSYSVRAMSQEISAESGITLVLKFAEGIDKLLESLQLKQIQELETSGRERWFKRHLHRKAHLDRIEAALH